MGGKSHSDVSLEQDYAIFSGKTNTTGGGFCSVRTKTLNPLNLSSYTGITLNVRSAQNFKYKFGIYDKDGFDTPVWQ
jgi:hypothetical protein